MLAMTKSKLSAVSDRQRQSAGEGAAQEEKERQRLAKEEEEARAREATRKQEEELAAAAAKAAQAAQESEACDQEEQAAAVVKAAQEEEELLRLANQEEEERAREEARRKEEQAAGGGGPMEAEQSIFHGPSYCMDSEEKEDKEKALMGGCDQVEKQAVVIVARPWTEALNVAEVEVDLVENVSQTPAHSAFEPCLFVSPLPSREAPPSSASFPNLSVDEAAGRGGKAMWCGVGGGNAMYSMTPGKGRCEIERQRDRETCLDVAECRPGEAREMSSMLSSDREGEGLSPTTVAFWQHSQVLVCFSTDRYREFECVCSPYLSIHYYSLLVFGCAGFSAKSACVAYLCSS